MVVSSIVPSFVLADTFKYLRSSNTVKYLSQGLSLQIHVYIFYVYIVSHGRSAVCRVVQSVAKLVQKEHQEIGKISGRVYMQYARHLGVVTCAFVLLALLGGQTMWIVSEWWLSEWAQSDAQTQSKWFIVYGCIVAGARLRAC